MFVTRQILRKKENICFNSSKEPILSFEELMDDQSVLLEIGQRLSQRRVALDLTQAELAKEAGVSKRTVERVEAGESTQSATLIRILRVLQLLANLDTLLPETGPRPMDLLKLRGKPRQRASSKKSREQTGQEWSWDDET